MDIVDIVWLCLFAIFGVVVLIYFIVEAQALRKENEELKEENLKFRLHDTRNGLAIEKAFYIVSAENRELRAELSEARKDNETLKAELDEARKSARKAWRTFYGVKK